jgi:hypothetical protein
MIFLKLIAIPLLYALGWFFEGCKWILISFLWFRSLFTYIPVKSGLLDNSYFIRGKKKNQQEACFYLVYHHLESFLPNKNKNGNTRTSRENPEIKGEKRISAEPNCFSKN